MYIFKWYAYMDVYDYRLMILDICSYVHCSRDIPQQVLCWHWCAYGQITVNCGIMQVCVDIRM